MDQGRSEARKEGGYVMAVTEISVRDSWVKDTLIAKHGWCLAGTVQAGDDSGSVSYILTREEKQSERLT